MFAASRLAVRSSPTCTTKGNVVVRIEIRKTEELRGARIALALIVAPNSGLA